MEERRTWPATVHGFEKRLTQLSNWTNITHDELWMEKPRTDSYNILSLYIYEETFINDKIPIVSGRPDIIAIKVCCFLSKLWPIKPSVLEVLPCVFKPQLAHLY